jgi:hypothetical protein
MAQLHQAFTGTAPPSHFTSNPDSSLQKAIGSIFFLQQNTEHIWSPKMSVAPNQAPQPPSTFSLAGSPYIVEAFHLVPCLHRVNVGILRRVPCPPRCWPALCKLTTLPAHPQPLGAHDTMLLRPLPHCCRATAFHPLPGQSPHGREHHCVKKRKNSASRGPGQTPRTVNR